MAMAEIIMELAPVWIKSLHQRRTAGVQVLHCITKAAL